MKIGAIGIRTKIIVGDAATWYLVKKYIDGKLVGGIDDAPEELKKYVRVLGSWVDVTAELDKLAEYPEFPEVPEGYYLADDGTFKPLPDFVTEDEMVEYVDGRASAGGGGLSRYLSTQDSDVAGYKKLNNVPDETLSEVAHTVNVGETLMHKFLYDFQISTTIIDAGAYKLSLIAKLSSTAGVSSIIVRFFLRHADNTETIFLEMSKSISNTTFQQIPIEIQSPAVHCVETDRFGVGIYFSTTLTNKVITTQLGDGASTYITVPIALRHTDVRDKNQDPEFQHVDTTTVKPTLDEADKVALWDSVAGKVVLSNALNDIETILASI